MSHLQDLYLSGLDLFNRQSFYECHDTLEELWLEDSSADRLFYQGLIQTAVAFYHLSEGRPGAARAMLIRALEKLDPYPERHRGIDLATLRAELAGWKVGLDASISGAAPLPSSAFPVIPYVPDWDEGSE